MKNKTAIILCMFLGLLFGGVFWWLTQGLNPHMWILRIGFTLSLMCLGVAIGCVTQILSLGSESMTSRICEMASLIERMMYMIRPLRYCQGHGCYVKTPGRKHGRPYCLACKEENNTMKIKP